MFGLVWATWRASVATIVIMLSLVVVNAQTMTSNNYKIQSDSINAGGLYSSSDNYNLEATIGEMATGESSSASYTLKAGYQQMQEVYLAMSGVNSVLLSVPIAGVTGGSATGSTSVTVTTDNLSGYKLQIVAENSPAMRSGSNTIPDYAPAGINPDYTFSYDSSDAVFGYTVDGSDVTDRFTSNLGVCGSGDDEVGKCWDGPSTTPQTVAMANVSNHPNGTETTVTFQVAVGDSVVQPEGIYVATTTFTALPL